jgi:formate-nitrite transporter family protein
VRIALCRLLWRLTGDQWTFHFYNRASTGRAAEGKEPLHIGIGVSASTFLVAMLLTLDDGTLAPPLLASLLGFAYTIGFIIVILARTDIFTEYTTIAILPVLTGDAAVTRLLRLWALVLVSNLVGCALAALLITRVGSGLDITDAASYVDWATRLIEPDALSIVLGGALAGWLMGLLSWLVTAARDTISQIAFVWATTFVIGLAHLPHIVAGAVDVFAGMLAGAPIGAGDLLGFLGLTVFGNLIGGIVFALLIRYSLVARKTHGH